MYTLNFNLNKTSTQPQAPVNRAIGRIIGELEVSEGINPYVAAYPFKYLPVCIVDNQSKQGTTDAKQGIVILKGTIVSAITSGTRIYGTSDPVISGIPCVSGYGQIVGWNDATTTAVDWVYVSIDDSYFGYEDDTTCLLVPCNGGATHTIYNYSSLDAELNSWDSTGDALTLGANYPVGVVFMDIYQDIRGKYLNYAQDYDTYSYASKGFIQLPYVDTTTLTDFCIDPTISNNGVNTEVDCVAGSETKNPYYYVYKKHCFVYGPTLVAGKYLKSDQYGRWVPETTPQTIHTVGQVKTVDFRFPKDLTETVDAYPTTPAVTSTQTYGVPADLYAFASDVLKYSTNATYGKSGTTPTAAEVLLAIQNCVIGYAKISILL